MIFMSSMSIPWKWKDEKERKRGKQEQNKLNAIQVRQHANNSEKYTKKTMKYWIIIIILKYMCNVLRII